MATLLQDLRYGVRSLLKQPGFAIVAIVTLALGIGANTAIFGIVNTVLLKPLPYREPDRVVVLWSHWRGWSKTWLSQAELADYQKEARSLEHVGAFQFSSFNLTGAGADAVRIRAATVQAEVFQALGARPIVGRVFTGDEDQPGHEQVAVIGESMWRAQFGGDPRIVGRTISLDGRPFLVVGVLPATLRLPNDYGTRGGTAMWVPLALPPVDPTQRGNHGLYALGRLRPGVSLPQAQSELDTIVRGFHDVYGQLYDPEFGVTVVPAASEVAGAVAAALLMLVWAVGVVLLIACANVANLLLARSESRQKEIAIRSVLGAGRSRLVRQMITEALLLSATGALLGVGLAWIVVHGLIAVDPLKIPRVQDLALDSRVLAFTAALSVVTAVVFGLVPALHGTRSDLQPALKEGGRDSRVSTGWLRRSLVVAEMAASMVLVVAALLLARSFGRLLDVDAGFRPSHVLTMRTSLPDTSYPDAAAMVRAYRSVARELRTAPGVAAAGAVTGLPLATTRGDWGIRIEGRPTTTGHLMEAADWQVITPGYFEAMGTPLRAGRLFTEADEADTLPVVLVNETMARRFWEGGNALGRRLAMGGNGVWLTVVGIVADVHHRGLDLQPRAEMYRPHAQFRFASSPPTAVPTMTWALRTNGEPAAATEVARQAIARVDRGLGVSDVESMDQVVADATSDRRLNMWLAALLGGLALVLATVGIYGVVAYGVTQRTHEIGVRLAIGASPGAVRRLILGEGCRLGSAGAAIGAAVALISTRWIRGLLFNVSPNDPTLVAGVAIALVAVAAVASYIPARRATRVDPMAALRK